jgi:hypothetical protein
VAEYTPLQLTAIGQNALAKAQTGIALQFTKVKFGDGTATDISALTDLVRPVMTVPLTSTSIVNGIVKISCLLSNDSLANGFYVKEIGIFATQNGQEFLYAYTKATNADYIPPASSGPITQQFNFQFAVQAGTNITFQVPNDAVVLQTEKGQANGVATLDANAKVPVTQLPIATPTAPGVMSVPDKLKLDSVQSGAEPNQNAFSNVKVGSTTISADSKTDTLELVAGSNITLTPDATNDKITIAANVPVTSVNGKTGAVSLTASDVGAETPSGAQAKADQAEQNAKNYATGLNTVALADTRSTNELPSYYLTSANGKKVHFEFKQRAAIGIPSSSGTYCLLITIVQWTDTSGGTVKQLAYDESGRVFIRTSNGTSAWNSWQEFETTAGAQSKATTAETNAKAYADSKATTAENNAKAYADQVAATAEANAKAASAPISHVGAGGSAHATATQTTAGFMSASDKAKLDGIQSGAEVNQNTFANVKVGATTIAADAKQDTLELAAGTGVVLTPDATNDKVTIAVNTASTSQAGIVQLVDSVSSTSTTQAATANAVKQAYDRAVSAENNAKAASVPITGGTMTGDLTINQLKIKNLNGSSGGTVKWYKVARIQFRSNPNDSGEIATFTGTLFVQRDYGNTANQTIGQVNFSFGVRGGTIKPVIFATGDGAALTNNSGYKFRVYKDADGWHYLYFMKPYYSNFATFLYRADGCTEYWIEEDPSTVQGLTLVWDSDNGATQDIYVGKNKVWHAGNDGAGSGLDADTVDGKHFSDIQADAQAKANQAEANAKAYTDSAPEAMQRNLGIFNVYKSGKDSNGIFTIVEYKRADGKLFARSVLSGGTSPQYTTRTVTYYAADGTTVLRTDTYTLTYDTDGDLISEVKQ